MSNSNSVAVFIERHLDLLQNERNVEIEQNALILSNCAPKLLEQKGLALLNLAVVSVKVGLGGRSLIELERPSAYTGGSNLPPHTFRPGDLGRIESHVSTSTAPRKNDRVSARSKPTREELSAEGIIYKVSDTRIIVTLDAQQGDSGEPELPERCRLVKLANSITYDRMEKTMKSLKDLLSSGQNSGERNSGRRLALSAGSLQMLHVLLGLLQPSPRADMSAMAFYDISLNDSQREAVRFAIGSKEVACIHGPPGTGKTHTLVEIIRQLVSPRVPNLLATHNISTKVLVCGASNLSVDNILERLLLPPPAGAMPLKCTRIGHPARVKGFGPVLESTLDAQSSHSEQAELLKDVKSDLADSLLLLSGRAKGQKGRRPKGEERKKLWDDVKGLRREYRKREKGVVESVISEAQVVLATCHSAGGRVLDGVEFDIVIIDEATQALEAACWIPILKGKRLVLAGDPMQLPPTILSVGGYKLASGHANLSGSLRSSGTPPSDPDDDEPGDTVRVPNSEANDALGGGSRILRPPKSLSTTMFERLERMYGPEVKIMLEVQYRMNKVICDFPSTMLYGSRLRSDASVETHLLRDLEIPQPEVSDEILGAPVVFFDTSGCDYFERSNEGADESSKCNENEAMIVKYWVEKLTIAGILPSQIAIITPYQAQVTLVSSLLFPLYGGELEIGTVDGMQGREKEAVIISLVRSNEKREVGFLKDKRRLNVAMTRARRHMCVVGDSSTVQHGSQFLKKWMAWLENEAEVHYGGLQS